MAQSSTQDRPQDLGTKAGTDFKDKATETFEKFAESAS